MRSGQENKFSSNNWLAYSYKHEIHCHICRKPFETNHTDTVRDQDQVTGQYQRAAHKWCNLRVLCTSKINGFFHNILGYDCDSSKWA